MSWEEYRVSSENGKIGSYGVGKVTQIKSILTDIPIYIMDVSYTKI